MSLKLSVHTTDADTHFAASDARLRSTFRLKIWVNWMPGGLRAASTRATELPTVPKPSSAIFTGAAADFGAAMMTGAAFLEVVAVFANEVLRLVAI